MARTKTSERERIVARRGRFPATTAEQIMGIAGLQADLEEGMVAEVDEDVASSVGEEEAEVPEEVVAQLSPSSVDMAVPRQELADPPWLESARVIRLAERLERLLAKCNAEVAAKRAAGQRKVAFKPAYNRAVMKLNQDATG